MDYKFEDWETLPLDKKREVWNHYWNPYEPNIGFLTKKEIVDNFIKSIKIEALQYGIGSFGFGTYMLFIILGDSKIQVPKEFAGLPVNKGVVISKVDNVAQVKFKYGGIGKRDLTQKIFIG